MTTHVFQDLLIDLNEKATHVPASVYTEGANKPRFRIEYCHFVTYH
jgi:hypothetical protein